MEQTDQPVEATEIRGAVVKMETGDCMGGLGLRASPQRWAKKLMTVASQLLLLFLSATPVACEAQVYSVDIYDSARTCESAYFIGSPPVHCGYVKYREYRDSEDRRLTPDLQHLAVRRPVFIKLQFSVYSITLPGRALVCLAIAVAVTACIIAMLYVAGQIQKAKRCVHA